MKFYAIIAGLIGVVAVAVAAVLHGTQGFYTGEGFKLVATTTEAEERPALVCTYWNLFQGRRAVLFWPAEWGPSPALEGYEVRPAAANNTGCP